MSFRSRSVGLLLGALGLAAALLGPGSRPAFALTGPCVWNEAKKDWDYPPPGSGQSCANDSYSSGTMEGYVASRGAILENGKPIWAQYAPDQFTVVGGKTVFVPGVPTKIAVADGKYEGAQVLAGNEVAFAVNRYAELASQYPSKFDFFRRSQVPSSFYDKNDDPAPALSALNPRTLWVMTLKKAFIERGQKPLLAEFPLDPRETWELGHTNYLVQTKDDGGLGSQLSQTHCDGLPDSNGTCDEGTISFLSAFFSEKPADQGRWGFCKDYNGGDYSTGSINNILSRDDVRAFADCDAHRIGSVWAPLAGAWVDSASRRMLQGNGISTQPNGGYTMSYLYLSNSSYWDTMFVTLNYQPIDPRSKLGSRWFIRKVVPAGATMELDVGKVSAFQGAVTGSMGISFATSAAISAFNQGPDSFSTDTHKPRSVNFPVEVAYMNGFIRYVNEARDAVPLNASTTISVNEDDSDDGSGRLRASPPNYSQAAPPPTPRERVLIDASTGKQVPGGTGGTSTGGTLSDGGTSSGGVGGAGGGGGGTTFVHRVQVPSGGAGGTSGAAGVGGTKTDPDGTPSPVYDDGLLTDFGRSDFANTDVHVFGPAGDLVSSRIGLRQTESPGLDCPTVDPNDPHANPICTVKQAKPEASVPIADFIRNRYPGARYKVVVVNRSTGYMGTGWVRVGGAGVTNGLAAYKVEGDVSVYPERPILMRPPNLKVEITRVPNFQRTGNDTPCQTYIPDEPCEQYIGFEGGGLNDDQQIIIRTEWLDWDGSPLPKDLPGFTARLSRVRSAGVLGAATQQDDQGLSSAGDLSHFQIQPNRHTQVLRVGDASAFHYYLHISGANGGRCGKSSPEQAPAHESWEWFTGNSPACASFAKDIDAEFEDKTGERPSRFVPIKVPVFDAAATAEALDLQIQNARTLAGSNPQSPIVVPRVDPIYTFVYRPEAQFSVYDLKDFASPQVITTYDPTTKQTKTSLSFGYTLGTSDSLDPLAPLGSQKKPTWSLGFDELVAAVNQDNAPAEWDDLESLLHLSPAEQVAKLNGLVANLSPSSYLALQLYLANDRGNPLYQDLDIPYLLQMSAEPIVLTRRENLGAFATQATLPPVLESYRPIPFNLLRNANVTVSAVNASGPPITLAPARLLPAGLHYFVLDGSKLTALALDQTFTLHFEASLPPDAAGNPVSQFPSHTVDISVRRDVVRSNRALGEVVEHDVNILDGSLRLSRQDFSLPGLGPELSFQRLYSNLHGETEFVRGANDESDLGPGWRHTLNMELSAAAVGPFGPASVPDWVGSLTDPIAEPAAVESNLYEDANQLSSVSVNGATFIRVNGVWVGEKGRQAKLIQTENCGPTAPVDCFQYVARDGTRYFYDYPRSVPPTPGTPTPQNPALVAPGGLAEGLGNYQTAAPPTASGSLGSVLPVVPVNHVDDRFGNKMQFRYLADDGRLDQVEDATHRVCKFVYTPGLAQDCDDPPSEAFKRLRSVTCLEGAQNLNSFGEDVSLTVNFCYDKDGNLAKVSRGKELERYQYKREADLPGGNFNLWKFSDARASTRTFKYVPGRGSVPSGIDPAVHFQKEDMVEAIEFPETVTTDTTNTTNVPVKPVVHFNYGSGDCSTDECIPDNTRTVTDPRGRGLKKVYRLNQRGNPVRIEEPKGKYTELVWSEENASAGCGDGAPVNGHALMKRTVNRGDKLIVTQFGYDADGNLTSECGPGGYTQTWDKFGLLASHTDFHGIKETWDYDDNGFLLKHVADAEGDKFTTEYTPDASKAGRVGVETVRAPSAGDRVTRYSYDNHGNLAASAIDGVASSTITVQHDARGRVDVAYDRRLAVTKYHYDTNDHVELVELPTDVTKAGVDHLATQLKYSYDVAGNQLTETDRNGLLFTYAYTAQNQVKSVTRDADVEGTVTRFLTYDELGNVTTEEDWARAKIIHTYDDLGFREITTNRAGDQMIAKHDLLGNVTSLTDFGNLETIYSYDDLNRELDAAPQCSDSPDCGVLAVRATRYEISPNLAGARYAMSVRDGGRTFYTGFDSRGLEVRRKDPIGGIYQSNYDELGQLRSTIDEARFLSKFDYDGRGYLIKTTALGVDGAARPIVSTVTPDPNGNPHEIRRWRTSGDDATLSLTTTEFDAWNRARGRTFSGAGVNTASESFKYDGNGNLVEHTDTGQRTRFWHRDKRGQVRTYTNAEQETRAYEQFDANGNAQLVRDARLVETTLEYDPEERVKMVWEGSNRAGEDRKLLVTARDGLGNPKTINDFRRKDHTLDYTARHHLKSETHPGKPAILYDYTVTGALDQITDARGFKRKFSYDGLDRVQDVFFPNAQTRESHTDYDAVGNVTIRQNRRNTTTENVLDDLLRVHQVNRFRGSGAKTLVLTNDYDDLGNVISTTDANGANVQFRYNNLNQLAKTVYAPVSDGVDSSTAEDLRSEVREYYPSGTLKTVTLPHDSSEQAFSTTYEYDNEDRLIAKQAAGELTSFTYDKNGNLKTLTKPEGQAGGKFANKFRQFDYDALNRLEYVTDEVNLRTKYIYDAASNLNHVYGPYQCQRDAGSSPAAPDAVQCASHINAPHVQYDYDPKIDRVTERLQYQEGPTLVTTFDEYDANDNVKTLTDPLRRTFHYSYDHYDRVTHSDYQDDPSTPYYRPQSVDIDINDDTNITTITEHKTDPIVIDTTVEERDLLFDRLVHSNQRGVIVDYDYYDNGNRKSVAAPSGSTSYSYDARNRLSQTVVNGAPTNYTYHQDGRIDHVELGNVTTTQYDYFPTQRVQHISHEFKNTTRQFAYDYDKNGNVLSAIDKTLDNGTGDTLSTDGTSFDQYDAADRLISFNQGGKTTTYGYERYNRKTEKVSGVADKTYQYDELSERLKTVTDTVADTVTTYTNDDNGNVVSRETQPSHERLDFKYDVLNQLKRVTRGPPVPPLSVSGLYDYDAAGRRIRQDQTDRGQVDSTYDGISVLEEAIRSLPAAAAAGIHYHYDGSSLLSQTAAGTDEYFHQDNLGSTANRSDGFATPTGDFKYDPFGGIRSQPEAKSGAAFTGQQFDQSTGLYYYGARFYDPALGRFLSEDTYAGSGAQPQSLQKYLYAYSNPGRFTDPTGHDPKPAYCEGHWDGGLCFSGPDPSEVPPSNWDPIVPGREVTERVGEQRVSAPVPPKSTPAQRKVVVPLPRSAEAYAAGHTFTNEDLPDLDGHPTSRGTRATQEANNGVHRDMTEEVGDPSFYRGRVMSSTDVAKDVGRLLLSVPKGAVMGVVGLGHMALENYKLQAKYWYLGPVAPLAATAIQGYGMTLGVVDAWKNKSKLWNEFSSNPFAVGEFIGGFVDAGGVLAVASKYKYIGAVADVARETQAAMHGVIGAGLGRAAGALGSLWGRAKSAARQIVTAPAMGFMGAGGVGGGVLPKVAVGAGLRAIEEEVAASAAQGIPRSLLDDIVDEANAVAAPGGAISDAQRSTLRQNLPQVQRRSIGANQQVRKEFERRQGALVAEWEQATGQSWPIGPTGRAATPHHIVPLESGGANAWWNLMPTFGASPNHALPGIPGPHAGGGLLRGTIQQSRRSLPPGTVTDLRNPQ